MSHLSVSECGTNSVNYNHSGTFGDRNQTIQLCVGITYEAFRPGINLRLPGSDDEVQNTPGLACMKPRRQTHACVARRLIRVPQAGENLV